MYDQQFSQEKQMSCEQVSQIFTEKSFLTPNDSLYSKSQTSKINFPQVRDLNDAKESEASTSQEINVQGKSSTLFSFPFI